MIKSNCVAAKDSGVIGVAESVAATANTTCKIGKKRALLVDKRIIFGMLGSTVELSEE